MNESWPSLEQKLAKTKKEKALLEEKLQAMDRQMKEILNVVGGRHSFRQPI